MIRKQIAQKYAESVKGNERESLGRVGSSLGSAEDVDMAFTSIDMGFNTGIFKTLELIHTIPKERLSLQYLSKIRTGINYSGMLLRFYRFNKKPPKPCPLPIRIIKYLYKKMTLSKIDYAMYMTSEKARTKFYNTINRSSENKID